jgi:2-C-methyl-D-erythritol 2,4-cyclodiphosphate synthase
MLKLTLFGCRELGVIRIGQGLDVHAFEAGEFVTLAGVKIPHTHGLKAHSDGDVVLHALSDALLGALAMGDIGQHFPDTDDNFKGADSRVLLRHVYQLIVQKGFRLVNADITVACERPKLAPHNVAMRQNIADDLQVSIDCISVKATTTEKLGFTGRQEGIFASAIVLLEKG